jgi:hypothetical protein
MRRISREEACRLIKKSGGKVFGCTFKKRSTGEIRTGRFRLGASVRKGLNGGPRAYDPESKGLLWVYRMAGDQSNSDGQRRSIPVEGIQEISLEGRHYEVL